MRFFSTIALVQLYASQCLYSQAVPPRPPNAWLLQPTPLPKEGKEQLTPERIGRDAFWDKLFQFVKPLTPTNAGDVQTSEGSTYNAKPGLADYPNRILLIAKFGRHHSVLTPSRKCIYTEITFAVKEVFERGNTSLAPGDKFTLTYPGGTIALPDGELISFLTHPKPYWLQPNHTYLLSLHFESDGDFYTVNESWDVTDGTVHANIIEVGQAQQHTSGVVGLTRAELTAALASKKQ